MDPVEAAGWAFLGVFVSVMVGAIVQMLVDWNRAPHVSGDSLTYDQVRVVDSGDWGFETSTPLTPEEAQEDAIRQWEELYKRRWFPE